MSDASEPPREADNATSLNVRRAMEGDEPSLERLVNRFSPLLMTQARYRLKGQLHRVVDPEDLVNDVWIRALPRIATLELRGARASTALLKFLSTVLRNRVRDLMEKHLGNKPRKVSVAGDDDRVLIEVLPASTTGIVSRAVRNENRASVWEVLEKLDPEVRSLIVLRGIEQNSSKVVAGVLGITDAAVRQRYSRALKEVHSLLPVELCEDLVAE